MHFRKIILMYICIYTDHRSLLTGVISKTPDSDCVIFRILIFHPDKCNFEKLKPKHFAHLEEGSISLSLSPIPFYTISCTVVLFFYLTFHTTHDIPWYIINYSEFLNNNGLDGRVEHIHTILHGFSLAF